MRSLYRSMSRALPMSEPVGHNTALVFVKVNVVSAHEPDDVFNVASVWAQSHYNAALTKTQEQNARQPANSERRRHTRVVRCVGMNFGKANSG